ncbi:hypothetical protein M514_10422 [Trichuris suis]|uniref:Uncharacterized protein n=1 Tax=Trichuris suis TaxID=68888 RepID=A0A085NIK6_9BILA|nr:hypothetical protein M513_10422 [Trichuris suis]KFD69302.1 hypothetical protein M514_10422 [Trichuris suis]
MTTVATTTMKTTTTTTTTFSGPNGKSTLNYLSIMATRRATIHVIEVDQSSSFAPPRRHPAFVVLVAAVRSSSSSSLSTLGEGRRSSDHRRQQEQRVESPKRARAQLRLWGYPVGKGASSKMGRQTTTRPILEEWVKIVPTGRRAGRRLKRSEEKVANRNGERKVAVTTRARASLCSTPGEGEQKGGPHYMLH